MEDRNTFDSVMDGQPYKAGHHAATLRRMLWREHLGLLPAQRLDGSGDPNAQPPDVCPNNMMEGPEYEFVADPMSDQVWDMWTGNATKNTEMFRHLFRADPDDNSKSSSANCFPLTAQALTTALQSKPSRTTQRSFPGTANSSKVIFMTRSWTLTRYGRSLIRSEDTWYGCRWNS